MTCQRCGTINGPSASFCAHCGASLTGTVIDGTIAARIEPPAVAVVPGGRVEVTLSVRNDTSIVEHVELTLDTPREGWAEVEPSQLRMMPGASSQAVVRLLPPRSTAVAAGLHPLRIAVNRAGSGELLAFADARVELGSFYEVSAQVIPRHGPGWLGSRRHIWLDNTANAEVTVELTGSDPDDMLRFTGISGPVTIPCGAKISRAIRIHGRRPNLHLRSKEREFTVAASWGDRQKVVASGALTQRSLIVLLLLILVAFLIVAVLATSS